MSTELMFGKEAREKLMIGVNKLARTVSVTLGGAGKNVMVVDNLLPPGVSKDGIKLANSITLDDFIEQSGLEIVRQGSARSAKEVGDGTTTATVLATEILNRGVEVIDDLNVHDFKKGMESAYERITENLEKNAENISDSLEKLESVATVSANGDSEIGRVVSNLVFELGDSEILIMEDKTRPSGVVANIKQGYTFPRGSNPFFETSQGTGTTFFGESKLLIVDRHIARIDQLAEVMDYCGDNGFPLIIMYETIESKALENLVLSKMRNGIRVCAVEFPDAGEMQQLSVMDIAKATGATILKDFHDFDEDCLGDLTQFKSDAYNTTLLFSEDYKEEISALVQNIKDTVDLLDGYKLEDSKKRLQRLSKGVGEIRIGYTTEVEYSEVYDRVEDAIGAVRGAMQEGIVVGGGIALLEAVDGLATDANGNLSFEEGFKTVVDSCKKPFYQILSNAGLKESEIQEAQKEIKNSGYQIGFNARTKKLENLKELGIIDPKKVTRSALLASVSVASTILTTDCIIYPKVLGS